MNIRKTVVILSAAAAAYGIRAQSNASTVVSGDAANAPSAAAETGATNAPAVNKEATGQEKPSKKHTGSYDIRFMNRVLRGMGISQEQINQVTDIQRNYKRKMGANAIRSRKARERLSQLERRNAPREKLSVAIDEICDAYRERLWIIADNRMAMQQALGPEKYEALMKRAREKYRASGKKSKLPPHPPKPAPVPDAPPEAAASTAGE